MCGIPGICGRGNVIEQIYPGLIAIQHGDTPVPAGSVDSQPAFPGKA